MIVEDLVVKKLSVGNSYSKEGVLDKDRVLTVSKVKIGDKTSNVETIDEERNAYLKTVHIGTPEDSIEIIDEDGNVLQRLPVGAPAIATAASTDLTISGGVSNGELIVIGDSIIEVNDTTASDEGYELLDTAEGTKTQASGEITVSAAPAHLDYIQVGEDIYVMDLIGDGVSAGAIQVDLSAFYEASTATLTFLDVVSDGEVVEINGVGFEFDTDGEITEGNVRVWIGANTTAGAAIIALASVIRGNTACGVNAVDGDGDTLVVTARTLGIVGDAITVSTTCANASWGVDVTHLAGGASATPAETIAAIVAASAGGTEAVTITAGEGDDAGKLLIAATAAGVLDGSAGNSRVLAVSGAGFTASASTLEGGTDMTAAEAIAALDGVELPEATLEAGEGLVAVTANEAGVAGNAIEVSTTMENAAFDGEYLEGGIDGGEYTEADARIARYADGYLYIGEWVNGAMKWYAWQGTALN